MSITIHPHHKKSEIVNRAIVKARTSDIIRTPFHHMYVEDFLPSDIYENLKKRVYDKYQNGEFDDRRHQDSKEFINSNLPIFNDPDFQIFREILGNKRFMKEILDRFYSKVTRNLLNNTNIHDKEFEFVYSRAGRFQNIHIDVPFKLLSFVLYFPETELSVEDQFKNGTVLYDKEMNPCHSARFKGNSLAIFAPHYYSYHGFHTSVDRMAMVCFYKNKEWQVDNSNNENIKSAVEKRILKTGLREYNDANGESDVNKIKRERKNCKINAPSGRVMIYK